MEDKQNILRIIDASLNRCSEGLRVCEEALKFIIGDETAYKEIREIRHCVGDAVKDVYKEILSGRNVKSDSGRHIKEDAFKDIENVLIANFKRAQEALRVLEEYTKTIYPSKSALFKELRFKTYNLEQRIILG